MITQTKMRSGHIVFADEYGYYATKEDAIFAAKARSNCISKEERERIEAENAAKECKERLDNKLNKGQEPNDKTIKI